MIHRRVLRCSFLIAAGIVVLTGCSERSESLQNASGAAADLQCKATPSPSVLGIRGVTDKGYVASQLKVAGYNASGARVDVKIVDIEMAGTNPPKYDSRALNRAASSGIPFGFSESGIYPIRVQVADARGNNAFCDTSVTVLDEPSENLRPSSTAPESPPVQPRVAIMAEGMRGVFSTHFKGSAVISWLAEGVEFCQINKVGDPVPRFIGDPNAPSSQARGLTGLFNTDSLEETTNFTATCYKGPDMNAETVVSVVSVDVAPPPQVALRMAPVTTGQFRTDGITINLGELAHVQWISNDSATQCALFVTASQGRKMVAALPTTSGQTTFAPLPENAKYDVQCRDAGNNMAGAATAVGYLAPRVTLKLAADQIDYNTSTTLSWESSGATSCTGTGFDTGGKPDGSANSGNRRNNVTFSIKCMGPGGEAGDSISLAVSPSCNIHTSTHKHCSAPGGTTFVAVFQPKHNTRIVPEGAHITTVQKAFEGAGPKGLYGTCYVGMGVVPATVNNIPIKTNGNLGSALCPVEFISRTTPLIIDAHGEGLELTPPNKGAFFDIKAAGSPIQTSWVANPENSWFLVLDLNENDLIDDGTELFGDHSIGPDGEKSENGFDALAKYDSNQDGFIDERDEVYAKLQLWSDRNLNGISEGNELSSLAAGEIAKIDLDYLNVDETNDFYGNKTYQRSVIEKSDGTMRAILDVWFVPSTGN